MSQRRGITTDQFINVLQVIQLGRKTGRLIVERGEGTQREEGEILFDSGHAISAHTSYLTGEVALSRLKTWGVCRFIFINSLTDKATSPLPEIHSLPGTHETSQESSTSPRLTALYNNQNGDWRDITGPISTTGKPHRLYQTEEGVQMIVQANLSRLHRHLFLLLDGQRTQADLTRLLGRRSEDVQQLLLDLESIGVIQR